jgi:hypothetical protein
MKNISRIAREIISQGIGIEGYKTLRELYDYAKDIPDKKIKEQIDYLFISLKKTEQEVKNWIDVYRERHNTSEDIRNNLQKQLLANKPKTNKTEFKVQSKKHGELIVDSICKWYLANYYIIQNELKTLTISYGAPAKITPATRDALTKNMKTWKGKAFNYFLEINNLPTEKTTPGYIDALEAFGDASWKVSQET